MFRIAIASAVLATCIALSPCAAWAQISSSKPKSPGEIAAASKLLAEKNADCQRQAKEQKLGFLKRRSFVRNCMKDGK